MNLIIRKPFIKYKSKGLACAEGSSMTKQSFKDESSIDKIISRYQQTQALGFQSQYAPQYGELNSQDYKESLDLIKHSQSMFNELPSNIRDKFSNNPHEFIKFVENENNSTELYDLGLTTRPPVEKITEELASPKLEETTTTTTPPETTKT